MKNFVWNKFSKFEELPKDKLIVARWSKEYFHNSIGPESIIFYSKNDGPSGFFMFSPNSPHAEKRATIRISVDGFPSLSSKDTEKQIDKFMILPFCLTINKYLGESEDSVELKESELDNSPEATSLRLNKENKLIDPTAIRDKWLNFYDSLCYSTYLKHQVYYTDGTIIEKWSCYKEEPYPIKLDNGEYAKYWMILDCDNDNYPQLPTAEEIIELDSKEYELSFSGYIKKLESIK